MTPRLRRHNEDGVESMSTILVMPIYVVLIFALMSISHMWLVRAEISDAARNGARMAAADGGDNNPRTNSTGVAWSVAVKNQLWKGGKCTRSQCTSQPTVTCNTITRTNGTTYTSSTAQYAGELVTCKIVYPFKGVNKTLLDGPIGLGMGRFLGSFTVEASARSETGSAG